MASNVIFIPGTAKWAKLKKTDKFGNYCLDLYVDAKDLKKAQAEGLRVEPKEDEDGTFIRLRRNPEKLFDGMEVTPSLHLYNKETEKYEPFEGLVGNGSKVTCKVTIYDTVRGKGHRLEGVGVDSLVAYEDKNADLPF